MSLSRQRERKRPFPPKKFVSVQVPIIPYYQRYRYEQEVKGLKDRDELELYPEDTRIFTENVIKRVFAREMVWDGYKWVRKLANSAKRIVNPWIWWQNYDAGFDDVVLTVLGRGTLIFVEAASDYHDLQFQPLIDGHRVMCTSGDSMWSAVRIRNSGAYGYNAFSYLLIYNDINPRYVFRDVLPRTFRQSFTLRVKNPDTANTHAGQITLYFLMDEVSSVKLVNASGVIFGWE